MLLAQISLPWVALGVVVLLVLAFIIAVVAISYGNIWVRAYMCSARVTLMSLIGMSFRRVNKRTIVDGKIMAVQAGISIEKLGGVTTRRLEALYLAGGNVPNVIKAIIAAHRAGMGADLDFDRAAAIDLAGRDVLDAVQTSVYPKVIDCPDPKRSQRTTLSAIAKNGVELKVRAADHRPNQYRTVDRRGDRGDDHRASGRRHHHRHRVLGQPF